jgi:hypothetical protein
MVLVVKIVKSKDRSELNATSGEAITRRSDLNDKVNGIV